MSEEYELILQCYRSGQMSEAQWQAHLNDLDFRAWHYLKVTNAQSVNPAVKESLTVAEPVKEVSDDLLNALRSHEQASMDGSLVKVSHQALDEAIAILAHYGSKS